MSVVSLTNLGKLHDRASDPAVKDFNLTTEDGEFIVLVGPSGCGKTTTMRMIAGLEEHTEGSIEIEGRDVAGVAPKDRDIAMVFQSYALYPHMTVRENLAFSLKLKKQPRVKIEAQVQEAAEILGLQPLLDRKPKALSGGQRQRVALGRAIVRQPQVFLMDEPLSNLDAKLRIDMRAEITKLHRKLGVTTFYVTHDQTEAMTMGQRIVVMRDGSVQQIDTPDNLYRYPVNTFVASFIGTPSMNLLEADVDEQDQTLTGPGFSLTPPSTARNMLRMLQSQKVYVGIRPQDLHLQRADQNFANRLQGQIEVVEPLGAATLIQTRIGATRLTAEIEPHYEVSMEQPVELSCDSNRLYLFDPDSEKRLAISSPVDGESTETR